MEKRKKKTVIGFYPEKIHLNAMAFCINNGITIIPELLRKNELRLNIRIEKDGLIKNIISPKTYSNNELWKPIYEIYLTYFKKMVSQDILNKSKENYISFIKNP